MKYLISTPNSTNLAIEPTQFTEHLKAKWQYIDIHLINNPKRVYGLEWVMPMENGNLEGFLQRTGQCIALEGDVRDCAKFALWFRTLIDNQYSLFFYDQAYAADLELQEHTTENDIVKCFVFTSVDKFPQPIETISSNTTFFNHPITQSFIESLKRHGVDNTLINEAINELIAG